MSTESPHRKRKRSVESSERPLQLRTMEAEFHAITETAFVDRAQVLENIRKRFDVWQAQLKAHCRVTWGQYIKESAGINRKHGWRLIRALRFYEHLEANGVQPPYLPSSEQVVRKVLEVCQNDFDAATILWGRLSVESESKVTSAAVKRSVRLDQELADIDSTDRQYYAGPGSQRSAQLSAFASSKSSQWYTSTEMLDRVRRVFGGPICTDPASDRFGNSRVSATTFYSAVDNGLLPSNRWTSPVFLNTPSDSDIRGGSKSSHDAWCQEALRRRATGEVEEALIITYAACHRQWFQHLLRQPHLHCCLLLALEFDKDPNQTSSSSSHPNSSKAPHPLCALYFGPNAARFEDEFADVGTIIEVRTLE